MTKGKIAPVLISFTVPLLISALFQQMYNLADTVIAGRFLGEDSLAAVGASFSVTMIFMAVAFGCNAGCSVVIGRLFGAKKYRKIKTAVGTTLIAFLSLAVILTVVGRLISATIMKWINTPDSIMVDGLGYLNVYVYGLVFLFLYNACNGIFTALGDSMTPLSFLIVSSLLNIGLDILFVTVFDMGVAGIAWATFITQGLAATTALLALLRRLRRLRIKAYITEQDLTEKYPIFSGKMLKDIAVVAVPSIFQQGVISIGNLLVQGVINKLGKAVIAGFAAGVKLRTFAMSCFVTSSNALATYSAQNMGAEKVDRVKRGFKYSLILTWCVVLPFTLLYVFNADAMVNMFAKNLSADALSAGTTYIKVIAPFFFIVAIKICSDAVLKGSGKMFHFLLSTTTDLVLRVGLAYILSVPLGAMGVWWAWPIGWGLSTIISCSFYLSGLWHKKKVKNPNREINKTEAKIHN